MFGSLRFHERGHARASLFLGVRRLVTLARQRAHRPPPRDRRQAAELPPVAARALLQRSQLPTERSRRPDSNRGPLHYELSASNSRIRRFPCKMLGQFEGTSPWKSEEVRSAPAMCSNGVPIAPIPVR